MKSTGKVLSIAALTVVGASMAHAQAFGFGQGYTSASFSESAAGIYFTSSTGTYQAAFDVSSIGSNWYSIDYFGGTNANPTGNPIFVNAYGESGSTAQVGGSGVLVLSEVADILTFTNTSSAADTLTVQAYTYGYGSGTAQTWNDVGFGYGIGEIYDTAGTFEQFALGYGQGAGLGDGGDTAYYQVFDSYFGYSSGSFNGGSIFPGGAYAYGFDTQSYSITLAPGASDTFVMVTEEEHEAFSTTPGPEAVVPFAIGLIGFMRRRRKR